MRGWSRGAVGEKRFGRRGKHFDSGLRRDCKWRIGIIWTLNVLIGDAIGIKGGGGEGICRMGGESGKIGMGRGHGKDISNGSTRTTAI